MFNSKKKKYFIRKAHGVQCMTWDLEFKREKTLMVREEVRSEYDAVQSKLQVLNSQILGQLADPKKICEVHNPEVGKEKVLRAQGKCTCDYIPNHMDLGEVDRMYDQKELMERERDGLKAQMSGLDVEVHGAPRSNEYPEGYDGIDQQLGALRELMVMLRQYLKTL